MTRREMQICREVGWLHDDGEGRAAYCFAKYRADRQDGNNLLLTSIWWFRHVPCLVVLCHFCQIFSCPGRCTTTFG